MRLGAQRLGLGAGDVGLLECLDFGNAAERFGVAQGIGALPDGLAVLLAAVALIAGTAGGLGLAEIIFAFVARLPITLGDDRLFFLLDGIVEFAEAIDVLFGEHRHVNRLGKRAAEVGVAGVGGGGGQQLEGGVEVGPAAAEWRDGGEDFGDGFAVALGVVVVFRRLAEEFLEARLEQAVVAQRDGDTADRDGFRRGIEHRDFLTEGAGGLRFFLPGHLIDGRLLRLARLRGRGVNLRMAEAGGAEENGNCGFHELKTGG